MAQSSEFPGLQLSFTYSHPSSSLHPSVFFATISYTFLLYSSSGNFIASDTRKQKAPSNMASIVTPSLNTNDPPGERRRVPGNVYYVVPYYHHFLCLYGFLGSFFCAWISDYVSLTTTATLWTGYAISCMVMILTHPLCCAERKKVNEEGKEVLLRRPLIGFKACEVTLDLEGIRKGMYDPEDGNVDPRLHDGYRYGPALLRI